MNGKVSKKVNKKARRMLNVYLKEVSKWSLWDRLIFAWKIVKGDLYS